MSVPLALTIGGMDPSGGAGIGADLATFAAAGVFGASVATAVTAQDTTGVTSLGPVGADVVRALMRAVLRDLTPDAVKIAMLPTTAEAAAVADMLPDGAWPVVLDPVLRSTSGHALADDGVLAVLREVLIPRAAVVTPNADEAHALTGVPVTDVASQEAAAEAVVAMGAQACVVTGGHLDGPAVTDVYVTAAGRGRVGSPRGGGGPVRGTGCRFSAALTAMLARGVGMAEAIERAHRAAVSGVMRASAIGRGARVLGVAGGGGASEGLR